MVLAFGSKSLKPLQLFPLRSAAERGKKGGGARATGADPARCTGSKPGHELPQVTSPWREELCGGGQPVNNVKRFKDFYMKATARIWPCLSYTGHVGATAGIREGFLTSVTNHSCSIASG